MEFTKITDGYFEIWLKNNKFLKNVAIFVKIFLPNLNFKFSQNSYIYDLTFPILDQILTITSDFSFKTWRGSAM
jgi:hypothetical protein